MLENLENALAIIGTALCLLLNLLDHSNPHQIPLPDLPHKVQPYLAALCVVLSVLVTFGASIGVAYAAYDWHSVSTCLMLAGKITAFLVSSFCEVTRQRLTGLERMLTMDLDL